MSKRTPIACFVLFLSAFFVCLSTALTLQAAQSTLHLTPETCDQQYRDISPADGRNTFHEFEKCSLCKLIVENSRKWNWREHYEALCTDVPEHAMQWCAYYVCNLVRCASFQNSMCTVELSKLTKQTTTLYPCPAKYVCWNCLQVPSEQVRGCFDSDLA
eukprot:GILJ01001562.1.p1 GENE.GILJ01001562.1~~GILJ01001562.1.p1  ORF type:complete len:173 (+),score=10.12 GILJ01001562.1:45-521(+)